MSLRWSDEYREHLTNVDKINLWYQKAIEEIREGKYTFLGSPVNVNNPKEVIAVLYILTKDYESFHERL